MSDWKKLRELAEAATPGPWELWTSNSVRRITAEGQQDGGVLSAVLCGPDRQPDLHGRNRERDLEFIAAANPATLLALLDENDSLRAEVERLRMQHSVACSAAEAMTGAFERSQQQLSAALVAKDEACEIADSHIGQYPYRRRDNLHVERIKELRTIGKEGGRG